MSYRCPDCGKFVPVELQEDIEFQPSNPDLDCGKVRDLQQSVALSGKLPLVLLCAECGEELAEGTLNVEMMFRIVHEPDCPYVLEGGVPELDYEVSAEVTDRYTGEGCTGKHLYGAEAEVTVSCLKCDAEGSQVFTKEIGASGFRKL